MGIVRAHRAGAKIVTVLWVTVGVVIGGGRHEDGAARNNVSNDFLAVITGVDYAWSFGIAR